MEASSAPNAVFAKRREAMRRGIVSTPAARRKQKDAAVSLRRQKAVNLKRRLAMSVVAPPVALAGAGGGVGGGVATPPPPATPTPSATTPAAAKDFVKTLATAAPGAARLAALKRLRVVLSTAESNDVLLACVEEDVVSHMLTLLSHGNDEHKLEATWCLANLAAGSHECTVTVLPAVPALIGLTGSGHPVLAKHAAWVLANVAGDSQELRRRVVANGAVRPLVALLACKDLQTAATAAWAMSNVLQGGATSSVPFVEAGAIQALIDALKLTVGDGSLQIEAAWCLSFMCDREDVVTRQLVAAGLLVAAVPLLGTPSLALARPIVRCVGNCLSLAEAEVLDAALMLPALLPGLKAVLRRADRSIQKEGLWLVSNVAGGTPAQAAQLIHAGFIPPLVQALGASLDIQREAAYTLLNLALQGDPFREAVLLQGPSLAAFVKLAASRDMELVRLGLSFMDLVLRSDPEHGPRAVEEAGGMDQLTRLELTPPTLSPTPLPTAAQRACPQSTDVSEWAGQLYKTYFCGDAGSDSDSKPAPAAPAPLPFGAFEAVAAGAPLPASYVPPPPATTPPAAAGAGAAAGGGGSGSGSAPPTVIRFAAPPPVPAAPQPPRPANQPSLFAFGFGAKGRPHAT